MTRDLDTPLEIALGVVSRQGLGIWMLFMTWTRLTVHWVVSNWDLSRVVIPDTILELGEVTYACGWMRMCAEFRDEIILRRGDCKIRENSNFLKKGKIIISVKIRNFYRYRMTKWTSLLESSREI